MPNENMNKQLTKERRLDLAHQGALDTLTNAEGKRIVKATRCEVTDTYIIENGGLVGLVSDPNGSGAFYSVRIYKEFHKCDCHDMQKNAKNRGKSSCKHVIALAAKFLKIME